MRGWRRGLLVGLLAVALSVPLSCLWTLLLNRSSDRILHQWHQPQEVNYGSFDPYTLSVIEAERDWLVLGGPKRRYRLFIGRGTEAPAYGLYLDYTLHPGKEEMEDHIRACTAEWSPEGVTFVEPTGHRLFIPKRDFVGGR